MDIIYGLSEVWAKYAIFLQSGEIWKKYVMVILFVWLWIFAYWKIYGRKSTSLNKGGAEQSEAVGLNKIPPSPLNKVDWGASERQNKNKKKKNQIFDEIMDEIED